MSDDTSELPGGWTDAILPDLLGKDGLFTDGDWVESKDQDENGGIRLIQLADVGDGIYRNRSSRFLTREKAVELGCTILKANDLLISRMADPLGRACLFPGDEKPSATVVDVCIVRLGKGAAEPNWLVHAINSPIYRRELDLLASGTTRRRISRANLGTASIPLPPLPEQRRIVAKIEALQARSRKAREALEAIPPLLEQFRQSVLAAAFRGDLTADWREQHPDVEPASVLLERIRAERRRKWEQAELAKFKAKGKVPKDNSWKEKYVEPEPVDDADLPELPEGWCWAVWNDLSEWITYGFTRPMPHVEAGIPIITAKNVANGAVQFEDTHFTTDEAFRALSDKDRPEPGDILITKDGTIGRAAVVPEGKTFCINQSVAVVYLRSCIIDRSYLLRLIEAPMTQEPIREKARGMALQHLSITDFGRMAVPVPPIAEQNEIVKRLENKLKRLERVKTEMTEATSSMDHLDQSILAKAFRGELVPQDPNDEPASVLLERIRAERADDTNGKPPRGRRKLSRKVQADD